MYERHLTMDFHGYLHNKQLRIYDVDFRLKYCKPIQGVSKERRPLGIKHIVKI
jgi:hypothetical protein